MSANPPEIHVAAVAKLCLFTILSVFLVWLLLAMDTPSTGVRVLVPLAVFLTYRAVVAWRAIRHSGPPSS